MSTYRTQRKRSLNFLCSGSPSEIFDEFASLTHACHTFTSDRLGSTGKLWPHPDSERDDGSVVLFEQGFPTPNGRAKFVPADWTAAPELPDEACPLVLNTGRLLEHWHMGSMTCRAKVLDAIEPEALIHVHPDDARDRGIAEGDEVRIASRCGRVTCRAHLSWRDQRGAAFLPFHFHKAAAALLTIDELDSDGKIPELKFCTIEIERWPGPELQTNPSRAE